MPKQTMSDAVIASTGFAVLRPKPGVADSSFLGHWCFSLLAQEDARRAEVGSNYPAVNESDLNRFRFPAMPVSEQRRIAEILDTLDDQIRLTEASLQKRREVRIGLIRDLLQGAYDSGSVTTIGDLAEHVGSGATPRGGSDVYQRSGVLFIRSQNVHFEGLVLDDVAYISEAINSLMARSEVFANDVLINITGASIGRCCVMPPGLGKANVNQHVCAIRLPHCSWVDATYLSEVLASHWGQHQVDLLNAGGNREGLNYQQLRAFKVAWPSQEERQFAVRAINCMDKALWPLKRQVDSLRALKAGLMADLLSGWVRVPEGVV
jgi:type I restriction enzyme S subunit